MAIKSGIPAEIDWALSTVLDLSFNFGGDVSFVKISGLAEALMEILDSVQLLVKSEPNQSSSKGGVALGLPRRRGLTVDGQRGFLVVLAAVAQGVEGGCRRDVDSDVGAGAASRVRSTAGP